MLKKNIYIYNYVLFSSLFNKIKNGNLHGKFLYTKNVLFEKYVLIYFYFYMMLLLLI